MAEAVVSFVLEQLGELLVEFVKHEAKFLGGVGDQVERAKAELRLMRGFLKDADARARGGDERVRNWVAEIREATYDLEDAILTYAAEVTDLRSQRGFRNVLKRLACLFCEGVTLHRVGSKIEGITTDISSLRSTLETYGIRKLPTSGSDGASSSDVRRRELRRDYSHIVEPDIVGLDEDVNKLVACLTESGASHRVVSICGMGGLGKTTLARKLYQHNKIRGHFDCVAWASISQQCQVSSVWKELLIKISPDDKQEIREMKDFEICGKLYEILKVRKCLIVLDDIWTAEVWKCLSPAFPRDETRSKILLTTRNRDLALYADEDGVIHEPRCLDNEESWELFEKVFRSRSRSNHEELKKKKQLGREMLEHCGGLPLAIIVLRGLLSQKQTVFEWEAMQKNIKTYINKGNLFEQQGSQISGVSWVLGLSYDELPYQLKPCFMHLANFPEDHEMKVRELCQIWMAEGFVPSEEAGYECLHELVQRCMVLRGKMGSINGRIKTCRIHDLMRDLCLSKAQEENFVKVFDFLDRQEGMDSSSSTYKVRRVAITFRKRNFFQEILPINKDYFLRSFICYHALLISAVMKSLSNHFHMLRVLKLEKCEVIFPKEIGELTYLHFLSLKNSNVNLLPKSICKLRHLQILDLRISPSYNGIEDIVVLRLDQLKHLFLPIERAARKNLIGIENSSNLQTLVGLFTSYTGLNLLAERTNLTKLEIYFDESWEGGVMFNSLRSLVVATRPKSFRYVNPNIHDVTSIILRCPQIRKLKIGLMWIEKLPEASQFSQELVKLTLDETFLMYDPMPTLEKLPKLRILRLVHVGVMANKFVCSSGGFPCLESLSFYKSFYRLGMKEWKVEEEALPNLCHLSLDKCDGLRTFPDCLKYITSLKEIVLGKHESDLVNTLKERGELHKLPSDLQFLLLTARSQPSDEEFEHA